MINEIGKQVWVVPKLEKIEMAQTAVVCPATGDVTKNMVAGETGLCGMGPTS